MLRTFAVALLFVMTLAPDATAQTSQPEPAGASSTSAHGQSEQADAELSNPQQLTRARNFFSYGRYQESLRILSQLVLPGQLHDKKDIIDAHRMLAIAAFQLGQKELAHQEFMTLMYLDSSIQLDPFLTPPEIVEYFEKVKADYGAKIKKISGQEESRQKACKPKYQKVVEKTYAQHSLLAVVVPFGFPQFDRGDHGWGALFLGIEAVSLVITGVSYASFSALPERSDQRSLLLAANYAAVFVFAVTYVIGVADGLLQHQDRTLIEQQEYTQPLQDEKNPL